MLQRQQYTNMINELSNELHSLSEQLKVSQPEVKLELLLSKLHDQMTTDLIDKIIFFFT